MKNEMMHITIRNILVILLITFALYYTGDIFALVGLLWLGDWTPDLCPHCGKTYHDDAAGEK
jgi:hypothetical protein